MNHPKIIAGRHGLPPTSNIPWSAAAELQHRREVLLYFSVICITAAVGLFLFLFRLWIPGAICLIVAVPMFFIMQDLRRHLYAMLLNKPRSVEGLTQWIEHIILPFTQDREAYKFICHCGRLVDMLSAEYFKDTRRFSVVCECGLGHFMALPPTLVRQ
jgi:hypothetical protein